MISGPGFLFCFVPQKGACACGGLPMPDANFMRQTPSTWGTGTLLRLALTQGSLTYWQPSCHPFGRALSRALSGVAWLLPRRSTQGVKSAFQPY